MPPLAKEDLKEILVPMLSSFSNHMNMLKMLFLGERRNLLHRRREHLRKIMLLRRQQMMILTQLGYLACCEEEEERLQEDEFVLDERFQSDDFFKDSFRMSRQSYEKIVSLLKARKKKEFGLKMPIEKCVAIGLYFLGSNQNDKDIGHMFKVEEALVQQVVQIFCKMAWVTLGPKYIKTFPLTMEKITESVEGFKRRGFPQCLGALGNSQIKFEGSHEIFYNNTEQSQSSMHLIGLIDYRYRFLYFNVGCPSNIALTEVYQKSGLKKELAQCELLTQMSKKTGQVDVPIIIIGNSNFPLEKNLITPYSRCARNELTKMGFNYELGKCTKVANQGMKILKARFQRINATLPTDSVKSRLIVKACCVLHNFLIEENDKVRKKWLNDFKEEETEPIIDNVEGIGTIEDPPEIEVIRKALALQLSAGSLSNNAKDEIADGFFTD